MSNEITAASKRAPKSKPSRPVQVRLNHRISRKKFARLAFLNFPPDSGGLWFSLDFKFFRKQFGRYPTKEEATLYYQRYIRIVRAIYEKHGIDVRYMTVRQRGKKSGRIHYFGLISGVPDGVSRAEIEKPWLAGYGNVYGLQWLDNSIDGLIYRFFDDDMDVSWFCSQNLKRE